jgi:hypothetical protein
MPDPRPAVPSSAAAAAPAAHLSLRRLSWPVRLAAVSLLAATAAPAAQAGPFEDALEPAWGVADPAVECVDPRTGDCAHPCDLDDCVGSLAGLSDDAEGLAAQAYAEAAARAAEAAGMAFGTAGCVPTAAALADAAASAAAAAGSAPGAAWQAANATAVAGASAVAGALGQAFAAADGAVAAAKGLPQAADRTLPADVFLTCDDVTRGLLGPTCGVWANRNPLPAVADVGLVYCPPPPNSTDELRILYCGSTHGVPKALDQFYENVTQGPLSPWELISQTTLLAERVQGCMSGHYPPCPKTTLGGIG